MDAVFVGFFFFFFFFFWWGVDVCFVFLSNILMDLHAAFTHILQDYFTGTVAIIWLPQCQWSNPEIYGLNQSSLPYHKKTQQITNHMHYSWDILDINTSRWKHFTFDHFSIYSAQKKGLENINNGFFQFNKSLPISQQLWYISHLIIFQYIPARRKDKKISIIASFNLINPSPSPNNYDTLPTQIESLPHLSFQNSVHGNYWSLSEATTN